MEKYTTKPFAEALGDILRERSGDRMGRFSLAQFCVAIAKRTGLSSEYIRLMVTDMRPLRVDVIEAVSAQLDIDPRYWVEYRSAWVKKEMDKNPELVTQVYEQMRKLVEAEKAGGDR